MTALFAAPPATPIIFRHHLPIGYTQPEEHQRVINELTARNLGYVEQAAKDAGVACESVHTTSGFPADEILKAAERHNCDLIVMASHSQSGLRGVFFGSIAQKVVNKATVPVMIVR